MTRLILLVVPLVGVVAALVAARATVGVAVLVGAGLGLLAAAVVRALERGRLTRLARAMNGWLGRRRHEPVELPRDPAWQQVAIAVNALGAAYVRRGQRLEDARVLPRRLVDALSEPSVLFDQDDYVLHANPAARHHFDIPDEGRWTAAQALGGAQFATAVTEARESGRPVRLDARLDGREVSVLAAPVGEVTLLVIADQTSRLQVNAMRRDFVANASHELKTPVSGIQALAEGLRATVLQDPEGAVALVDRLEAESRRLANLVSELLDLGRLEDGRVEAERGPVDLTRLIHDEVDRLARNASDRDVTIHAEAPDGATLAGVKDDLRLIVGNLLENAIVYNHPGGRVDVTLERADGAWRLRLSDTGIGIARRDRDRIFERFYRVDVDRSRATGGTGLGLALVRHATERHGGSIAVDSVLGQGSAFTVTLPIEANE